MLGKKNILLVSILFILTGIFLRLYQLNFENYWLDELVDFWVADPNITLHTTFLRRELVDDQTPYLFQLFLKVYLKFFGYDPEIGRQVPLIFGILSIPLVAILSYQVAKNNSFLLTILLVSINIYLIKYSQETRTYTLVFLLSTINLIFYYKIILPNLTNFKKIYISSLFIIPSPFVSNLLQISSALSSVFTKGIYPSTNESFVSCSFES